MRDEMVTNGNLNYAEKTESEAPKINVDLKDELLFSLEKNATARERIGRIEDIAYALGSVITAICSVIAALILATDIYSWSPYGKIIAACLAVVPALWAAAESGLHLRPRSMFNRRIASQLKALSIEVRYDVDFDGGPLLGATPKLNSKRVTSLSSTWLLLHQYCDLKAQVNPLNLS